MCVAHISLYDHYASIVKEEEKSNVCFKPPHVGIATKEEKFNVDFEPPCGYCKRGKKI
jgi:hypothetical protein